MKFRVSEHTESCCVVLIEHLHYSHRSKSQRPGPRSKWAEKMMIATYTLTSAKATKVVTSELADAIRSAIAMEDDLQPAYGVSITSDDGITWDCRDGRVAVESGEGGDDSGSIYIDSDDRLMVAWDSGVATPFAGCVGLLPA